MELAGAAEPDGVYKGRQVAPISGRSLAPWLRGETAAVHPPGSATGWELFGRRAIRKGDWKAVYVPDQDGYSQWQLYDLAHDRGETQDLAEVQSAKLAELLALWDAYVEENGVIEEGISIFDTDPARFETGWPADPRERAKVAAAAE